jgi:hypothetical protein
MGDDWIGWAVFFGFIAFASWLVIRGLEARRRVNKLLTPEERALLVDREKNLSTPATAWARKRFTHRVNVDGTPIAGRSSIDVRGNPLGRTSRV